MLISAGTNALPQCASRLAEDFVIYASGELLVLWRLSGRLEKATSLGSHVTCVEALSSTCAVAGTQNGQLFLVDEELNIRLLEELPASVICLAASGGMISAGTSDGFITIYDKETQVRRFKINDRVYPLALAICEGVVAVAGTSGSVWVFEDEKMVELSGHENWVHCLSFTISEGSLILASGSQDRYIRLWRFVKPSSQKPALGVKQHFLPSWTVTFEALLMGHDDWILSVQWHPQELRLLSSSSDSTLIIWANTEDEEIWTPQIRVGDAAIMGATTATGASGGFWTAMWLPGYIATVTRQGSWRVWSVDSWAPVCAPTGHTKTVTDICWFGMDCVLSVSLDQTTRLWLLAQDSVHEVSRPQIHGYDMIAACPLSKRCEFVSAGDEKTIRVFRMPEPTVKLLGSLGCRDSWPRELLAPLAGVPALGLSNKAENADEQDNIPLGAWPREDMLQRQTLWPEVEKLYGHGYEIRALAVNHGLSLLASCCKANTERHAVIRLFDIKDNWRQHSKPFVGHSLTVTRLQFSPDDRWLLSVGRDRKWCLFNLETSTSELIKEKAHLRIIWDCCWLSSEAFVTVSRDKTIKKWNCKGELLGQASFDQSLTACDFNGSLIAVGSENGVIKILSADFTELKSFTAEGRINRLSWNCDRLAIASDTARVETVKI